MRKTDSPLMSVAPDEARVSDAMLTSPTVHSPSTTAAQLRAFFEDDHKHMALLVDGGKLVGTVERGDLSPSVSGDLPASAIATLEGRTVDPDAGLLEVFDAMARDGRRRLAVVGEDSTFLGLLCLKASGLGFCSDDGVAERVTAATQP